MTEQSPAETASPAVEPETPPPPPSAPGKGRKVLGWLVAVAVVGVLAGGAVLGWPHWKGVVGGLSRSAPAPAVSAPAPAPGVEDRLAALRADLDATRERLRQVEARPAASGAVSDLPGSHAPGPDPRLAALETALAALRDRPALPLSLADEVKALADGLAELKRTSADAGTVLRLADRIEQAESTLREVLARRSSATALLLAAGQLREAVAAAMPYDAELRALAVLAGDDAEVAAALAALKPRAAAGIPTRPTLVARFGVLEAELVRADALPVAENWWRASLNRIAGLVIVRREDGQAAGDSVAAVVARTAQRLAENDLDGATAELSGLSGPAAALAAPWLDDARARAVAEKALSGLTAHVIALAAPRQ